MGYFACTYEYGPADIQAKFRPEHRAYISGLLADNKLATSGPFESEEKPGALLLLIGDSLEEAEELIAADPMYAGGAVLSYQLRPWNPVFGQVGSPSS